MINQGIFKEAYELAVAYRYDTLFKPTRKDKDRIHLIKEIIMDKSPASTREYKDFYKQDLESFNLFHKELKEIKKYAENHELESKSGSTPWYHTWGLMANKLPGLHQVRHNLISKIYRDKDVDLIQSICDWYLDNEEKNRKLFEKVYEKEGLNQYIIKIIFEKWDSIKVFKR